MAAVAGRSTGSLGVMAIAYAWICKFCGVTNSAGTDACAVCKQPAIARPIDVDPSQYKEVASPPINRDIARLPVPLRVVVGVLWAAVVVGAVIERFAWSIGAEVTGIALMVGGFVPALLITKLGRKGHDA